MKVRKWVKILPYFILKKIAMTEEDIKVKMREDKKWYYLYEVDYGEYILINEKIIQKHKKDEKNKRKRKLEKLKRKKEQIEKEIRWLEEDDSE